MSRINVQSFDFDGCIFNINYIYSESESRLIKTNKAFISQVSKKIQKEKMDEVVFMVGSNRQSYAIDIGNCYLKGSCFPALVKLGKEFQKRDTNTRYRLDPYLLTDTYGDRPLGENFVKALAEEKESENYPFSEWLFDESKLTILYAQMHKLSSENPNDEIVFDFYDDRLDILHGLKNFFNKNTHLMSKNLTLRLHCYDGEAIQDTAEIKGIGEIDNNYQENIKLMITCVGLKYPEEYAVKNDVLKLLNLNEGLSHFIKQRKIACLRKAEYVKPPLLLENAMTLTTAVLELSAIEKKVCNILKAEMNNFIARKKIPLEEMNKNDQARYLVVSNLHAEVVDITNKVKQNLVQEDNNWKKTYKDQLTNAVKASLLNNKLDKYNLLEKIGIGLLNLISLVFSPIKKLVTHTWFFSTQGKPKEAVQDTLKIIRVC